MIQVIVSSAASFFSSSPSSSPVKTPLTSKADRAEAAALASAVSTEKPPAASRRVLPFNSPVPAPSASPSLSRNKSPGHVVKKEEKLISEVKKEEAKESKRGFVPKKWQGGGGQERGGAALGALCESELPNGAKNCLEVSHGLTGREA